MVVRDASHAEDEMGAAAGGRRTGTRGRWQEERHTRRPGRARGLAVRAVQLQAPVRRRAFYPRPGTGSSCAGGVAGVAPRGPVLVGHLVLFPVVAHTAPNKTGRGHNDRPRPHTASRRKQPHTASPGHRRSFQPAIALVARCGHSPATQDPTPRPAQKSEAAGHSNLSRSLPLRARCRSFPSDHTRHARSCRMRDILIIQ